MTNVVPQFRMAKGAVVGHDRGTTVVLGPLSQRLDSTTTLPGGTLRVKGLARIRADGALITLIYPVVGGTGRFAGAKGTLTTIGTAGARTATNTYNLRY